MPQGLDLSPIAVGETVTATADFGSWLAPGATISQVLSVTVSNFEPATGSPFISLNGLPLVATVPPAQGGSGVTNGAIMQQWTGQAAGVARIVFTFTTSDGQTLIGRMHQAVEIPDQ